MNYYLLRIIPITLKVDCSRNTLGFAIEISDYGYFKNDFENNIMRLRHKFISAN